MCPSDGTHGVRYCGSHIVYDEADEDYSTMEEYACEICDIDIIRFVEVHLP